MNTIAGYQIEERIYEGVQAVIYRGLRIADNQPVIIKILKAEYPTPEDVAKFRLQYELMKDLHVEGIVKPYGIEMHHNSPALIMEDFGGMSLKNHITAKKIGLEDFLKVAIQLSETLGELHQHTILHKDIRPANIIINLETEQVKIADFGIASRLSKETPTISSPNTLEGTLAYMSPEQTGRMNRVIDYRTDFYSLGATFYEMLTGRLPFPTTDAMELVHSHMARTPASPHDLNPKVPKVVSAIVMKLLAKNAEDRYQSAYGLRADLQACLTAWQQMGQIDAFLPGQHDLSDRFEIPQKLYGREAEIDTLMAAFDRVGAPLDSRANPQMGVARRGVEMMLVAGYSGIGKSALVNEVHKPIARQRGYFINGKFDQFQRNIPYAALIQAFAGLMRQLLTESKAQIDAWKDKLVAALGPNGRVIVDVIPEVEHIIGEQPPAPELPPTESQNRFNLVFQSFVRTFAQKAHPLVIFLDDLQWADSASLKAIELLITDQEMPSLLILGAYRDNEVSDAHPLMLALAEIEKIGAPSRTITLQPLDIDSLNQLVADTLRCEVSSAQPLASLVMDKTQGNPFFVVQFLTAIYAEELLTFDNRSGRWEWEIDEIHRRDITDNVVELMAGKIQRLGEREQAVLRLAACVGNQFDLNTLSIIHEKSLSETADDLWEAIGEGLVLPIGDAYKFLVGGDADLPAPMRSEAGGPVEQISYRFLHDRVQQAAYSLIAEEEKKAVHLQIGRLMLKNIPKAEQEERIFDIVNQLNFGLELIGDQDERYEVARLNLIAGVSAKAATAYQPAFTYLKIGLSLLEADSWDTQYELTVALHTQAAEAAYLSDDFALMEKLGGAVQERATLLDQVKVYEVKTQAYILENKWREALQVGLEVLLLLGVRFPKRPTKLHILLGLLKTKFALAGKQIERLIDLPEMTDPHKLAIMRILANCLSAAYSIDPEMLPLIVFKAVRLSVKHGPSSLCPYPYGAYALILCGVLGDIDAGYRFGKLALGVLERFNAREQKSRAYFAVNSFAMHWKAHVRETLQPLREGIQSGWETGDIETAAYSVGMYAYHGLSVGRELIELEREITKYRPAISSAEGACIIVDLVHPVILNLIGRVENPSRLKGENYDEAKMLEMYLEVSKPTTFLFYLHKLMLCYLFAQYPQAVENAAMGEKYIDGGPGMLGVAQFYFYDSLARLAVYASASKSEQKRLLKKVARNQKKMKKWAFHAPMNHRHKYDLVEAERARVLNQDASAMESYEKAITGARDNEYVNEEALALELAAKFYLERGKEKIAQTYMIDAHYAYQRWGAMTKVRDLEEKYARLLARRPTAVGTTADDIATHTITDSSSTTETATALDLNSVVKASQSLSGEIVLDRLMEKLMRILIENAGAQKGFLILEKDGRLFIEAAEAIDDEATAVSQSTPVETSEVLSATIVNYVARVKEDVVLNDAAGEGLFTDDAYIIANQPKSILCTPLINQGKRIGLLYLENNLTTGAFTADRLEVLNLLSTQAAISIENAFLYENLEQLVDKRTEELQKALVVVEQAKAAAETELQDAHDVQMSLMPETPPEVEGLEIFGKCLSAKEVSGDFFDYLSSNVENEIAIVVGDVTGHGMQGAMNAVMTDGILHAKADEMEGISPASLLEKLNHVLASRFEDQMNVTMVIGLINGMAKTLALANAGHHAHPLLVRNSTVEPLVSKGMPLGMMADLSYQQIDFALISGDVLVFMTDGIIEAKDSSGQEYQQTDRLNHVIAQFTADTSAEAMVSALIDDATTFGANMTAEEEDDITVVVVKVL